MKKFVKSRVVEVTFLALLFYWVVAPLIAWESRDLLFIILRGGIMAAWIGVLTAYAKPAWNAVREPAIPVGTQIFLAAAVLLAFGITGVFAWGAIFVFAGMPDGMRLHLWNGFFLWSIIVASSMFLITGALHDTDGAKHLGRIVAVAIALTVAVIYAAGGFPS